MKWEDSSSSLKSMSNFGSHPSLKRIKNKHLDLLLQDVSGLIDISQKMRKYNLFSESGQSQHFAISIILSNSKILSKLEKHIRKGLKGFTPSNSEFSKF